MRLPLLLAWAMACTIAAATEPGLDAATDLKISGDRELVRGQCTGCHSARLITRLGGSAAHWLQLIRWMQTTQNLWQFEPGVEQKIVACLAQHYPVRGETAPRAHSARIDAAESVQFAIARDRHAALSPGSAAGPGGRCVCVT